MFFRARSRGCSARLHKPVEVDDPRHFIVKGHHIHAGDSRKFGKKRVMSKLKNLAKNTKNPIHEVIASSIQNVKKPTLATLPNEKTMKRMVNQYRRQPGAPKNPHCLAQLRFIDDYCVTLNGEQFILYDSINEYEEDEIDESWGDRMVIFSTQGNLNFLSQCDEVYMDGTFSVVPPLFKQLYSIHGKLFI